MSPMEQAASKPRALPRLVLARENCKGVVRGRAWLCNCREQRSEGSRRPWPLCRSPDDAVGPARVAGPGSAGVLTPGMQRDTMASVGACAERVENVQWGFIYGFVLDAPRASSALELGPIQLHGVHPARHRRVFDHRVDFRALGMILLS